MARKQSSIPVTEGYTLSDKLAIALACLAAIMAIILFLVEKSPVVVLSLLAAMMAFAVYPSFHFFKGTRSRIIALVTFALFIVMFGASQWPKKDHPQPNQSAASTLRMSDPEIHQQPEGDAGKSAKGKSGKSKTASTAPENIPKTPSGCTPASMRGADASLSDPPRGVNIGFIGGAHGVEIGNTAIGADVGFDNSCSDTTFLEGNVSVHGQNDLTQWYTALLTLPTLDKDSVETAIGSKQTELQQWGRGIRPDITAKLRGLEDNPAKLKSYLESIVHPRSKQQ